ncbi:MAG: thrombospondin type 3 repeat-containing protein [Proteobacteria bacterium]|nr:thrombospondin type 3 repeat-containing protein [Pseudomonadota bacterium]
MLLSLQSRTGRQGQVRNPGLPLRQRPRIHLPNRGTTLDHDERGYDDRDNCPFVANADQKDSNRNGRGDACDTSAICPAHCSAPAAMR